MQTNAYGNGFHASSNFWRQMSFGLGAALVCLAVAPDSRANVYATDIRLNGRFAEAALYIPCGTVQISYILNEPASAGVVIDILDGATVVHSITNAPADRGFNAVIWNAYDYQGRLVPLTTYTVRVTAASHGYGNWTKISDEDNNPSLPGNYAWDPVGIAVNQNTNSPYYGRVFVANASVGINPGYNPGDRPGILKLNADGSKPGDGADALGVWNWAGDGFSPWKLEVSGDDSVYVNDWTRGVVLSFDQWLYSDSRRLVLRDDNRPAGSTASFSGPFLTGSGTNTAIWMADVSATNSLGIQRWPVGADGVVATNEFGTQVVQAGGGSALDQSPYDLAVDTSNRVYAIQYRTNANDPSPRLLCFPPYTNATLPLTNAEWAVGGGNNALRGASGVAVSPSADYVAVAFRGVSVNGFQTGGRTRVFSTADGSTIFDLVTDTPGDPSHQHTDVAWDNVGNLYDLDNSDRFWRVYSPPGSNAATTVALSPLLVSEPPLSPILNAVGYTGGQFTLELTGRTNVSYVVEASASFSGWLPVATNISYACPTRTLTVSAPPTRSFYRAYPLQ